MAIPSPSTKIEHPQLAAALAERERFSHELYEARQAEAEAAQQVEQAEAADRRAEADHLRGQRSAKPRPTEPKERVAAAKARIESDYRHPNTALTLDESDLLRWLLSTGERYDVAHLAAEQVMEERRARQQGPEPQPLRSVA